MVGGTTLPDEAEPGIGTRQTQAVLRVPNNRPLRGWRANASPRDRKGRIPNRCGMTKKVTLTGARIKRALVNLRNVPLMLACVAVALFMEATAAGGIFQTNTAVVEAWGMQVRLAFLEAGMSLGLGLAALFMGAVAAELKNDPRPEHRKRAGAARLFSFVLLIAPVYYAGQSFAYQHQLAKWAEYTQSEQYTIDRQMAEDRSLDSMARREAAYELRQAIRPLKPEFELGAFLWAFLIYGAVVEAVRLGWKPRPETEAERKRRIAADAAAARKAKREAEKKAAEAKAKEEARKGRGAIIPFLKSAER